MVQEAAQEAISSPLLADVSISGARGVLINITGGTDLAIDEVMVISSLIHEEAGDEAEIIFGAVNDPALEGQVRVTVIATGFDYEPDEKVIRGNFRRARPTPPVRLAASGGGAAEPVHQARRFLERTVANGQPEELDMPTFIRRLMD